ncbi:MAG TPA: peptide deformylase [Polyangiaceae bacterium]
MSLLKIATIGNQVLRENARPVSREELAGREMQLFIDDLVETMRDARGAGLAANQVHRPVQVCAIEVRDNPRYPYKPNIPLTILVNPVIEPLSAERFTNNEGCLSVPDLRGEVLRHAEVRVRAWDRSGHELDFAARGLSAGTYQHEVDHLHGKLFVDSVSDSRTLTSWKEFERNGQAAFVERARALVARFGS